MAFDSIVRQGYGFDENGNMVFAGLAGAAAFASRGNGSPDNASSSQQPLDVFTLNVSLNASLSQGSYYKEDITNTGWGLIAEVNKKTGGNYRNLQEMQDAVKSGELSSSVLISAAGNVASQRGGDQAVDLTASLYCKNMGLATGSLTAVGCVIYDQAGNAQGAIWKNGVVESRIEELTRADAMRASVEGDALLSRQRNTDSIRYGLFSGINTAQFSGGLYDIFEPDTYKVDYKNEFLKSIGKDVGYIALGTGKTTLNLFGGFSRYLFDAGLTMLGLGGATVGCAEEKIAGLFGTNSDDLESMMALNGIPLDDQALVYFKSWKTIAAVSGFIGKTGIVKNLDKIDDAAKVINKIDNVGDLRYVDNVAEQAAKGGMLSKIGNQTWKSSNGLIYGPDPNFGNRVQHVLAHTIPDTSKAMHSVFNEPRNQVLGLVDEAWTMRSSVTPIIQGNKAVYNIPMGRVIGTNGENYLRLVIKNGNKVITAYPLK